MALICAPILVVVLVPLCQIVFWLKTGDWYSMDVATVGCSMVGGWYCDPMTWQGLHSLLGYVHVSLAVAFAMLAVVLAVQK